MERVRAGKEPVRAQHRPDRLRLAPAQAAGARRRGVRVGNVRGCVDVRVQPHERSRDVANQPPIRAHCPVCRLQRRPAAQPGPSVGQGREQRGRRGAVRPRHADEHVPHGGRDAALPPAQRREQHARADQRVRRLQRQLPGRHQRLTRVHQPPVPREGHVHQSQPRGPGPVRVAVQHAARRKRRLGAPAHVPRHARLGQQPGGRVRRLVRQGHGRHGRGKASRQHAFVAQPTGIGGWRVQRRRRGVETRADAVWRLRIPGVARRSRLRHQVLLRLCVSVRHAAGRVPRPRGAPGVPGDHGRAGSAKRPGLCQLLRRGRARL